MSNQKKHDLRSDMVNELFETSTFKFLKNLAKAVGVDVRTFRRWLTNVSRVSGFELLRLADALTNNQKNIRKAAGHCVQPVGL